MVSPADSPRNPSPTTAIQAAELRLSRGDKRGAVRELLRALFLEPLDSRTLGTIAKLSHALGAPREERAFAALAADPDSAQARYDLGYLLVDSGLASLGARYLALCLELEPHSALARYELGYAETRALRHAEAVATLQPLLDATDPALELDDRERFAAGCLLVENHLLLGDADLAAHALARIESLPIERDEAQLDALSRMLARGRRLLRMRKPGGAEWNDRDTFFLKHGGILLHVPRDAAIRPNSGVVGLDFLTGMLRRLVHVLHWLGTTDPDVEGHAKSLEPITQALRAELDRTSNESANAARAPLHFLRSPQDGASKLEILRRAEDGSLVFSLYVDPRQDAALCPDIVGQFAERLVLPWEEHFELFGEEGAGTRPRHVPDDRTAFDRHATALIEGLTAMEGDLDDLAGIVAYYEPLRDLLVAGRPDDEPLRRTFSALRGG